MRTWHSSTWTASATFLQENSHLTFWLGQALSAQVKKGRQWEEGQSHPNFFLPGPAVASAAGNFSVGFHMLSWLQLFFPASDTFLKQSSVAVEMCGCCFVQTRVLF